MFNLQDLFLQSRESLYNRRRVHESHKPAKPNQQHITASQVNKKHPQRSISFTNQLRHNNSKSEFRNIPIKSGFGEPRRVRSGRMKRNWVTAFWDLISCELKMGDERFEYPRCQLLLLTPTEQHQIKSFIIPIIKKRKTLFKTKKQIRSIVKHNQKKKWDRPGTSRSELKQSGIKDSSRIHGERISEVFFFFSDEEGK